MGDIDYEVYRKKKEMEDLNLLLKKKSASLVVVRGRRRIGKSRLIQEFVKDKKCWSFSGLPPIPGITKQRQIDTFTSQVSQNLKMPTIQAKDWNECFSFLGGQAQDKKIVIVFDEISWMDLEDSDFQGHLKNAWDHHFSMNPDLIMILCGSVSSWIEENILRSTGFVGRISIDMRLEELSISESQEFWGTEKTKISHTKNLKSYR